MLFTNILLTLASLGTALAAINDPADNAEKLAPRAEFREILRRGVDQEGGVSQKGGIDQKWGDGGFGGGDPWVQPPFNDPFGRQPGPPIVTAPGSCDHDNDCPRLCTAAYGSTFNDQGTQCCWWGGCACSGSCSAQGGLNECDADNDCPRRCEERLGFRPPGASRCCLPGGTCNCFEYWCPNDGSNPFGRFGGGSPWGWQVGRALGKH
ncbi:hypothetical protein GTA08_BOTSDO01730 [Neofusicoccum parvum]|nr:hypothetical protein GTA08_BOTSDO01730 [Neofusicoccum parvum]